MGLHDRPEATHLTANEPELSVVMRCFNESEGIESLLRSWIAELDATVAGGWEIIVINDGSIDGTARVLDKLRKENRAIRVIHQLRMGVEGAARRGLELARGRHLLQATGDGRILPDDFRSLWEHRHSGMLVLGKRVLPPNHWIQRGLLAVLRSVIQFLFRVRLEDAASPFRLMLRAPALEALHALPAGFPAVNAGLAIRLAHDAASGVPEIPFPARRRPDGSDRTEDHGTIREGAARVFELLYLRFAAPLPSRPPLETTVSIQ